MVRLLSILVFLTKLMTDTYIDWKQIHCTPTIEWTNFHSGWFERRPLGLQFLSWGVVKEE